MKQDKYLSIKGMFDLYDISEQSLYSALSTKLPVSKYITKVNKLLWVEINPLIKRRDFRKKIWLRSHDNYYEITEHISENKLATILARCTDRNRETWVAFLSQTLFSMSEIDKSIINYTISKTRWEFFRITTLLIRRLVRLETKRTEKILQRLPNRNSYAIIYKERGCGEYNH